MKKRRLGKTPGQSAEDSCHQPVKPLPVNTMSAVDSEHIERYEKETRELLYQRVYAILLIGITLIPLFSILDFVVAREHFHTFLFYRLSCAAGFLLLLLLYKGDFGMRHPYVLALTAYVISGAAISLMVVKLGGYASYYYTGMIMVLIVFSSILPLGTGQAISTGLMLFLIYVIPVLAFSTPNTENLKIFFNNTFFFISFVLVSVLKCFEDTRGRQKEFNLKMAFDSLFEKYRDVVEQIGEGIYEVDLSGNFTFVNPAACRMTGYGMNELLGKSYCILAAGDDQHAIRSAFNEVYGTGQRRSFQWKLIKERDPRNNAEKFMIGEISINPVFDANGSIVGFRGVLRDVTEKKELEDKLQHMAYYDMLTGLPNRSLFYGLYPLIMARSRRSYSPVVLMMIDLNQFKEINDQYGHDAGDRVLVHVARIISRVIRAEDMAVRLGGDEFILLFQDMKTEEIPSVSKRVFDAFLTQEDIDLDGKKCKVSASIGVAVIRSGDDLDADEAKAKADKAMYAAKSESKLTGHVTCLKHAE
jgi:diguanylate cyclase (GGDEF)-like protein/PAS domain S-box-containing protein